MVLSVNQLVGFGGDGRKSPPYADITTGASVTPYASLGGYGGARLVDNNLATEWLSSAGSLTGNVDIDWTVDQLIQEYAIRGWPGSDSASASRSPRAWNFQLWNGSAYVTVDTQSGQTFADSEMKVFTLASPMNATRARFAITTGGSGGDYTGMAEMEIRA